MRRLSPYQAEDTSSVELSASAEGVDRFREAAYGLSVHWGLHSLSTQGNERTYFADRIPYDQYRERMGRFRPIRFDVGEWADLMVEAVPRHFHKEAPV